MSERDDDPLLRALRELAPPATSEGAASGGAAAESPDAERRRRAARAAYVRAFEREPWHARLARGRAREIAVPVVLAAVVVLYMSWAIDAATKLMQ